MRGSDEHELAGLLRAAVAGDEKAYGDFLRRAGQRSVVAALSVDGRSIRETAKSLGMSEAAVRVALHRGLMSIARRFARN